MNKKLHIIYILTFSPKYENYKEEEKLIASSSFHWKNKQGKCVGIWKEDWAHQIGNMLIQHYPNLVYEVWRPDIRAEKVYKHTFENNLIHRSFPVVNAPLKNGIRKSELIYSPLMESSLEESIENSTDENLLLLLPASRNNFSDRFPRIIKNRIPILNLHFVNSKFLLGKPKLSINPVRLTHELLKARQLRAYMRRINNLLIVHKKYIPKFKEKYNCNVFFTTVGVDLDYWQADISSSDALKKLNLPKDKHIFLFSSRITPEYQIDRVLNTILSLKDRNIFCVFTSHGSVDYVNKLKQFVANNKLENHVRFTGFINEETLKLLYCACDTFFMTSITNAGPVSTFLALLMEKQIITTNAGLAAELLTENKCGLLVSPRNYNEWYEAMKYAIDGNEIKVIKREIIKDNFDWNLIIPYWYNMFEKIVSQFYSK